MSKLAKYERSKLMQGANAFHHRISRKGKEMLEMAHEAGARLNTLKVDTEHGQWLKVLSEGFQGTPATAANYMRIDKNWDEIEAKCKTVLHFGMRDAIKYLQPPTDNTPPPEVSPEQEQPESQPTAGDNVSPVVAGSEPDVPSSTNTSGGSPAFPNGVDMTEDDPYENAPPSGTPQGEAPHVDIPMPGKDPDEWRENTETESPPKPDVGGQPKRQSRPTEKPSKRSKEVRPPRVKDNPNAELIRRLERLKKNLLSLLGYLPSKEYKIKEEAVFVEAIAGEFSWVMDHYMRALQTRSDVRINPPTLEDCQAIAEDMGFNEMDAEDYFEARDRSGWHYGSPAVNPVRDIRRDMSAYLRLRRRGEARDEARYEKSKAERQARDRSTDVLTANAEYVTEEDYHRKNGERR